MNIGLYLILSVFFLTDGVEDSKTDYEQPESSIEQKSDSKQVIINENIADQNDETKNSTDSSVISTEWIYDPLNKNYKPVISGTPTPNVKQGNYYDFTPLAFDKENQKLEFSINEKPTWALFDPRTGSISGQPNNPDVGIYKNISITVIDSYGATASLKPFDINVVNTNDKPTISGNTPTIAIKGINFSFTPQAKDPDVDIGLDKLNFSIENQPSWTSFDKRTGSLVGNPNESDIGITKNIVISVRDKHGIIASLKPFDLQVTDSIFENKGDLNNDLVQDKELIALNAVTGYVNFQQYAEDQEQFKEVNSEKEIKPEVSDNSFRSTRHHLWKSIKTLYP